MHACQVVTDDVRDEKKKKNATLAQPLLIQVTGSKGRDDEITGVKMHDKHRPSVHGVKDISWT